MTQWYAINTKSHREHLAEFNLGRLGVETFCPQLKQKKVIRRVRKTVVGPLFPGYLFARFDLAHQCRAVKYAGGVRRIVTFGSTPAVVDEEMIEGIRARVGNGFVTLCNNSPAPGQVVSIQEGPLRGIEVVFEREMTDQQRAVVLLRALAYQARVVVRLDQIALA